VRQTNKKIARKSPCGNTPLEEKPSPFKKHIFEQDFLLNNLKKKKLNFFLNFFFHFLTQLIWSQQSLKNKEKQNGIVRRKISNFNWV